MKISEVKEQSTVPIKQEKKSIESLFFALAEDEGDSDLDFDLLDEALNMPVLSRSDKTKPSKDTKQCPECNI